MSSVALVHEARPSLASEIREVMKLHRITPRRSRLSKGDLVSLSDPRNRALYLVGSGAVKLTRVSTEGRVLILGLVASGELFGETGLLGRGREDAAYAEAMEPTELDIVSKLSFQRLLQSRSDLGLRLLELLAERCAELERRLERQIFEDVPTRLAHEILRLAERYGIQEAGGTRIGIRMSQSELGSLIGASREMVSLTLSQLRKRGAVVAARRRLIVRPAQLRRELAEASPRAAVSRGRTSAGSSSALSG